jgi:membrane glycosyltransferase
MSYLSSPLWLLFLLLSSWETARLILQPINYFPRPYSLSPLWPEWHPDLAVTLVTSTLVLLFLPKMLAVVDVLCSGRTRDFGGFLPLTISLLIECLTSMVLAPIRMLAHSRFVTEPLLNIRLQWAGQNRTDETTWKTTFLSQLPGTLLAGCWLIFTTTLDLNTLLWSLPVALPLLLATPISMLLGRKRLGRWLERHQLLTVSTERHGSHVLFRMAEDPSNETQSREITHFEETLIDTSMNALQQALARNLERGARTTVLQRLRNQCLAQGPAALTTGERSLLARDRESLKWLHQAIWQAEQNSHWWRQLNRRLFR